MVEENIILDLAIPNREIRYIYNRQIMEWFESTVKSQNYSRLYKALTEGDAQTLQGELSNALFSTISYLDSAEAFYHGFLLGILSPMEDCIIKSNRKTGRGRADIFVKPVSVRQRAVIIEIKVANKVAELEQKCHAVLQQIDEKNYAAELHCEVLCGID